MKFHWLWQGHNRWMRLRKKSDTLPINMRPEVSTLIDMLIVLEINFRADKKSIAQWMQIRNALQARDSVFRRFFKTVHLVVLNAVLQVGEQLE